MKSFKLLLVKETKAQEKRVALIPKDVAMLIADGHECFVEQGAGDAAGFTDDAYREAGASIRVLEGKTLADFKQLFDGIDVVVRAKRPERWRENLENKAMQSGTIMIGALDPFEKNSSHVDEYHQGGILAYSIDQLTLAADDPMNVLAAMSKLAGRLALLDAIEKCQRPIKKVVIIGYGVVGRAAFGTAQNQSLPITVMVTSERFSKAIRERGGEVVFMDKNAKLTVQQVTVCKTISDADIVITSARQPNRQAPLLIPTTTLLQMQPGAVVVDMALSEGGNVAGSEHDTTSVLDNGVMVTNTSGYPKALPREASELWSLANLHFLRRLANNNLPNLSPC